MTPGLRSVPSQRVLLRPRSVRALSVLCGASALFTFDAQARRAGITETGCTTCHGSNPAELEVTFDPPAPAPGETMVVEVTVRGGNLQVAGVAINLPAGGQFSIPAGEPLSIAGTWAIHSQPKPASDGEVRFHVEWTAPAAAGSGPYTIAALAANDDKRQSGDATAVVSGQIAFGCDAVTLYRDTDGDGVGVTSQFLTDCDGLPGFASLDGDCDDKNATVFPGAPELCNQLDDDCDGVVDEDIVDQIYYLDEDGDGYGYAEAAMQACVPPEGYVTNPLDCHWLDAAISPDGVEVCDFVDNDCDGEIDEGVDVYCGVGECRRKSQLCNVLCTEGEPSAETCNGLDDDCDGLIDEDFCAAGEVCESGACVAFADAAPVEHEPPNASLTPGTDAADAEDPAGEVNASELTDGAGSGASVDPADDASSGASADSMAAPDDLGSDEAPTGEGAAESRPAAEQVEASPDPEGDAADSDDADDRADDVRDGDAAIQSASAGCSLSASANGGEAAPRATGFAAGLGLLALAALARGWLTPRPRRGDGERRPSFRAVLRPLLRRARARLRDARLLG